MHLSLILDMAADALGDRPAVTAPDGTITYAELRERADALAGSLAGERAVPARPQLAGRAGDAVRRGARRRRVHAAQLPARRPRPACASPTAPHRRRPSSTTTWSAALAPVDGLDRCIETEPLGAVAADRLRPRLRHRRHRRPAVHVRHDRRAEGGGAAPPPRHVLRDGARSSSPAPARTRRRSSACRRTTSPGSRPSVLVDVRRPAHRATSPQFDAAGLGRRPRATEAITHAMVVPTMLGRILDVIERRRRRACRRCATSPTAAAGCRCRSSSGRSALLPHVDFVNAYGLTETSSTIAVLDARRPPRRDRQRRPGRAPAGSARSAGRRPAVEVDDPRPVGEPVAGRRAPARSGCAASRCRASTSGATPARRRLVRHPRRRLPRRRRLPVHRGPARRRDRARRREHLARRDRGRAARAPGRRRRRRRRVPDEEWGEEIAAAVVLVGDVDARASCASGCATGCARRRCPR